MVNDRANHIWVDNSRHRIPDHQAPRLLDEQTGWIRNERDVLTGFYSMYQPEVIAVEDSEYPYRMWFMGWAYNQLNEPAVLPDGSDYPGWPGGDAIFTARSRNLDDWEVYAKYSNGTGDPYWDTRQKTTDWVPVLTCQNTWYDDFHVGDPSIVYDGGLFYMAYSAMGTDKPNPEEEFPWSDNAACIMGAISTDGIHWKRSKEPLLIWENEYGFDETRYRDQYRGGYQRPSLMYEDNRWKIWYDFEAGPTNRVSIGYAENQGDFLSPDDWHRKTGDDTPLISHWVDFDVVRIGSIYYAYGDPFLATCGIHDPQLVDYDANWSRRQIVEAQSYDGIHWVTTGYFRPDRDCPANQIPQVFLDHDRQRVCLFYATQRGIRPDGSYDWRWSGFRYMTRDLSCYIVR